MNEDQMKKAHAKKLRAAKKYLGEKWLLHPNNRVVRNPAPKPVLIPSFLRSV